MEPSFFAVTGQYIVRTHVADPLLTDCALRNEFAVGIELFDTVVVSPRDRSVGFDIEFKLHRFTGKPLRNIDGVHRRADT